MKRSLLAVALLPFLVHCGPSSSSKVQDRTDTSPFLGALASRIYNAPDMTLESYKRYVMNRKFACKWFSTVLEHGTEANDYPYTFVFNAGNFDSMLRLKTYDPADGQYWESQGTVGNGFANFVLGHEKNSTLSFRRESTGSLIGEFIVKSSSNSYSVSQTTGYRDLTAVFICVEKN